MKVLFTRDLRELLLVCDVIFSTKHLKRKANEEALFPPAFKRILIFRKMKLKESCESEKK